MKTENIARDALILYLELSARERACLVESRYSGLVPHGYSLLYTVGNMHSLEPYKSRNSRECSAEISRLRSSLFSQSARESIADDVMLAHFESRSLCSLRVIKAFRGRESCFELLLTCVSREHPASTHVPCDDVLGISRTHRARIFSKS